MKKFAALVLALVLALVSVSAFAATEINWADLQEPGAAMIAQGDFVTFDEIAVKIWMPNIMSAVELSEEDTANGYIGYYTTEDGAYVVAVMYVDVDGMALEDYEAQLAEYGATEIEEAVINGLPAVTYTLADSDTACIAFTTQMGYILEVSMAPMSDEGFQAVGSFVGASIQAAE